MQAQLLLGTPLYVMFALGTLLAGWLGDRIDRLTLIAVFLLGAALTTDVFAQFFGWQSAFAIPGAASIVIGCALVFQNRKSRHQSALSASNSKLLSDSYSKGVQWNVFIIICISALLGGMVFNMVTISLPKSASLKSYRESKGPQLSKT